MVSFTAWIVFSGLCLSLASAACGDDCKAKGGKCSWKNPNDGSEYSGSCREGKWGVGEYCFCGYCYTKQCEASDSCKGKCQRRSPGRGWISTSYCNKNAGCKCWTKPICPSGWVHINQGCYNFFLGKSSWHNADKECKTIGGRLAMKIENDLPSLIKYAKLHHGGHSWWIGMSDISQEGRWFWTDGSSGLSTSSIWWASGQPDNLKGNEDCAHLWNLGGMLLGDTRCSADMAWDRKFEFRPLCQYGSNLKG